MDRPVVETKETCERLLTGCALPDSERARVQSNFELACSKLGVPLVTAQAPAYISISAKAA